MSEGRDAERIAALAAAIRATGADLLDVHADVDHHRSVFTFVGPADVVEAAALALGRHVVGHVDLRSHRGVHPRLGALDLVPFVPLRGATMADAVRAAHRTGHAFARELSLPVYFYGDAALSADRRELPALRRGEFEGLVARMAAPGGTPDVGPARPHSTAGAAVIGARDLLIAFNADLDTGDPSVARDIARAIRESSGGLPAVRALGVALASRGKVQVSMNLLHYRRTSPRDVMVAVDAEAARRGVAVLDYELVGCAPFDAFRGVDRTRVRMRDGQLLSPALMGVPQDTSNSSIGSERPRNGTVPSDFSG